MRGAQGAQVVFPGQHLEVRAHRRQVVVTVKQAGERRFENTLDLREPRISLTLNPGYAC